MITADLAKLPRPEIGKINMSEVFDTKSSFHPVFAEMKKTKHDDEVVYIH